MSSLRRRLLCLGLGLAITVCCGRSSHEPEAQSHVPLRVLPALGEPPDLQDERWRRAGERPVRALIDLTTQVDLVALAAEPEHRDADKQKRRRRTVAALAAVARRSQAALEPRLEELRRRGDVRAWRGFSVVNRMLVEATPAALDELARHPSVAAIEPGTVSAAPVWAAEGEAPPARERTSWAPAAVGADRLWDAGLDGTGVIVGIIDSGASASHEQLAENFLGPGRGWLDPVSGAAQPADGAYGHGTGVLSCAVGRNVSGVTLGIAPGARWAACAALPEGRFDNVALTECADWILTVAQPDVLINAWLHPEPGCERSLAPIVDAWRAAEILPVFAVGNLGPEAGTDRSPANLSGLWPGDAAPLSVTGLNRRGGLFDRSTRGPGRCDPAAPFPALAAPAADLITALPLGPSTYLQSEGTSFAAGFVAGAAALLLQRHPEATVVQLEAALAAGAVDLGPPGADADFGAGRLDLPASLMALDGLMQAANRPRP